MNRSTLRDVLLFAALVAIGVVGRLFQPEWGFTPIAAATIFAGYYFRNWAAAVLVPVAILLISDLWLPGYQSRGVLLAVLVAMAAPVALGRSLRTPANGVGTGLRWAACGLLPATLFFIVSNAAVWFFNGATMGYEPTLAGLSACYAAAIPFFRTMLAGDLLYVGIMLAALSIAHAVASPRRLAPVRERA